MYSLSGASSVNHQLPSPYAALVPATPIDCCNINAPAISPTIFQLPSPYAATVAIVRQLSSPHATADASCSPVDCSP